MKQLYLIVQLFTVLLVLMWTGGPLSAQQNQPAVKGLVKNEGGEMLPDVTVLVKTNKVIFQHQRSQMPTGCLLSTR